VVIYGPGGTTRWVSTYSNYSRKISIDIPSNFRPLRFMDMEDIYRITEDLDTDNLPRFSADVKSNPSEYEYPYYVDAAARLSLFASTRFSVKGDWVPSITTGVPSWNITHSTPSVADNKIQFEVTFSSAELLPDDKYLNIDVAIDFLCEEVL